MESSIQVKPRLAAYFRDYATYHRTPGNKACHYIGIPMIQVAVAGLLGAVAFGPEFSPVFRLDLGILTVFAVLSWYLMLDWRVGAPFGLVLLASYFLGRAIPVPGLWALFIIGWIFQGIGHYKYEKKSPAFLKNIEHLLVGPLWVFSHLLGIA